MSASDDRASGKTSGSRLHPWLIVDALKGALLGFIPYLLALNLFGNHVRQFNAWLQSVAGIDAGVNLTLWIAVGLGVLVEVIKGMLRDPEAELVQQAIAETEGAPGAAATDPAVDELKEKLHDFFGHDSSITLVQKRESQEDGYKVTYALLVVERLVPTGARPRNSSIRMQTVQYWTALLESEGVYYPGFNLQPKTAVTLLLAEIIDLNRIDFPGHREFSAAYHLTGVDPDATRGLFDAPLLQLLKDVNGLSIASRNGVILMQQRDADAGQISDFVSHAKAVLRAFHDSGKVLGFTPGSVPGRARELVQKLQGPYGQKARERFFDRQDLNAFLYQESPRRIPANLLKGSRGFSGGSGFLLMAGGFMALFALVFAAILAPPGWTFGESPPPMVLVAAAIGMAGAAIVFLALRFRFRRWRLLRHGVLTSAKPTSPLKRTGVSLDDDPEWELRVEFATQQGPREVSCKINGDTAIRTRRLVAGNKSIPILYLPGRREHVIFAEALLCVPTELE